MRKKPERPKNIHRTGKNRLQTVLITVIITVLVFSSNVFAQSNSFIYDKGEKITIPEAYTVENIIFNVGDFRGESGRLNGPEDIFINSEGFLFVADTGNNRVLKLTREGTIVDIFRGPENKPLNAPRGIFADDEGNMFIADTGNKRIVHLSSNGSFVEEFTKPDSSLLGDEFVFEPTKVALSPNGFLYVLNGQSIMMLDAYNGFRGFIGQVNVGFHLIDVIIRKFASEEQKRFVRKRLPVYYTNFTMDESGMIYATSLDTVEGEIKKLNSIGKNIYPNKPKGYKVYLKDIAIDRNGIITTIDNSSCYIHQYDSEGNLLAAFGGESSNVKGMFTTPTSLVVDEEGYLYVLDSYKNNIQVFKPTRFITLVHQAVKLYLDGEYYEAYDLWQEILAIDESYQIARTGIAKTLYKQKDWKSSMDEYHKAEDKEGYSAAFVKFRHELFRKHFFLVVIGLVILVAALYFTVRWIKRLADSGLNSFREFEANRMRAGNVLKFSLSILFHPVQTFELIKRNRDNLNYAASIIILAMVIITRVFYIFVVHFPLSVLSPKDSNIMLEMVKLILPVLTWVIASFAITSIGGGESRLGEIFVASSYCMLPYIVINVPLALLSNLMAVGEAGLFNFVSVFSWIWVLLLYLIGLKELNDYTVRKTIVICIISVAMMALIWATLILIYALATQLYEFIAGFIREARMRII